MADVKTGGGRHFARPAETGEPSRQPPGPSTVSPYGTVPATSRPASHFASAAGQVPSASRRRRKRRVAAIVSIVVVVLLACAGTAGYLLYRHHAERELVAEKIDAIVADIQTCDEVVIPLDTAVSSQIEGDEPAELQSLDEGYDGAVAALDAAEQKIADASAENLTDEEREMVGHLSTSVSSRREMLENGRSLLEVDSALATAQPQLQTATDKMVEANDKVLESVEAANEYAKSIAGEESSQSDPQVPVDLDNQALQLLGEAETALAAAKEAFPDADYAAYDAYLAAKKAAVEKLLEIDTEISKKRYNAASRKVDEYNALDAAATEAAAALPASVEDVFRQPYETLTAEKRDAYNAARTAAADADTAIKSYTHVEIGVQEG